MTPADVLPPIPVTILTGFFGSGKTTLLNRLLSEPHGKRIAVIENEFGAINIDHGLVVNVDEDVVEMSNGCLCCTVRGDLIRVLGALATRRHRFDYVVVETTGLADPGPVAQTFFVDPEVREHYVLDGIVTVVDALHVDQQLGRSDECAEQIGFADVLVLNKCDAVDAARVDRLEARLRAMNVSSRVLRAVHGDVSATELLDRGAFDLDRTLARRPTFLEPEYPFEWTGVFGLGPGTYRLELEDGPDPTMRLVLLADAEPTEPWLRAGAEHAVRRFAEPPRALAPGATLPLDTLVELDLAGEAPHRFVVEVPRGGTLAVYAQHRADEFAMTVRRGDGIDLRDATRASWPVLGGPSTSVSGPVRGEAVAPVAERTWTPEHEHDEEVGSVAIEEDGEVVPERFDLWLGTLLAERGPDLFRMKGFLRLRGEDRRFVFQGVHMLVGGYADRPWGDTPARNQLVLIGRRLDADSLVAGFRACLA